MFAKVVNTIVLFPSGTGKTYLIRAMLSELKGARRPVFCTPPRMFLTQMSLLTEAIMESTSSSTNAAGDEPGSVIVMEDVGEMLMADNVTNHVDETANLLNFSDGLMSLLGNTVFILTFNHEVSQINPALTRPGRCLGQLTVGLLGRDQAQGIAGFDLPDDREYTLAEAYEMRRVGHLVSHPVGNARRKAGLV